MNITETKLSGKTRKEKDLLGVRDIPVEYYFGVQTMRGLENFNMSGVPISKYPALVNALAIVKEGAAMANHEIGLMDKNVTDAIIQASQEIRSGKFHDHFVVDMIQGGAGTSTNLNANEVIANRALEIMGYQRGEYKYCHPLNHVNLSQSTNDAYPTAIKIALVHNTRRLIKSLELLCDAIAEKSKEFSDILKMGRTHLQDAVPMTLGQEFNAFASMLRAEVNNLERGIDALYEINMGATAIGTGINSDPDYTPSCTKHLKALTGLPLYAADDMVKATNDTSEMVINSTAHKMLAIKLSKMCNDLRLMASGPRAGLNEINLPPMQPGSSIMPGKVNPVIAEVVSQVAFRIVGNDTTITMASEAGQLQLNVMEPVMVHCLFESVEMLIRAMDTLRERCIVGITANKEVGHEMVYNSIGLVTALNPYLGYDDSTMIAKEALETGAGVYDLVLKHNLLTKEELDNIIKPENMIKPVRVERKK